MWAILQYYNVATRLRLKEGAPFSSRATPCHGSKRGEKAVEEGQNDIKIHVCDVYYQK